jgi:hypothetical protein
MTLFERPDAPNITFDYMLETLRASDVLPDPEIVHAEKLVEWIKKEKAPYIYLPRVYQYGPGGIRTAKKAREAIKVLVEHGYLIEVYEGIKIDSDHYKYAWAVNPRLRNTQEV